MSPYRWTLAFALGFAAIAGVVHAEGPAPATSARTPEAETFASKGDAQPASPKLGEHAPGVAQGTETQEPRVEIGPAVLRIYDETGRVVHEE